MKPFACCVSIIALVGLTTAFAVESPKSPAPPPARLDPAMIPIQDTPGLPRVLLIGNSISVGYTLAVRERLAGVANVHRIPANAGDSANGLRRIDEWLGDGRWDVIHFNFGLGDLRHVFAGGAVADATGRYPVKGEGAPRVTLEDYEKNLRLFVTRLRATGARLVFATTTPLLADYHGYLAEGELLYNETARRVMSELGVQINDLHAAVLPLCPEVQVDHVHFNKAGNARLADSVAAAVRAALATAPRP